MYLKSIDKEVLTDITNEDIIAWLKEQGEQTTNKIEPKFKVGDWITDGYVGGLITSIEDNYPCYKIADFMGGINTSIPFTLQDNYHLWTIADAKDGDVLVSSRNKQPFMYNGNYTSDNIGAYFALTCTGEITIIWDSRNNNWTKLVGVHPATKEQRDLLFQKMKEAGYEWNNEKKELNRSLQTLLNQSLRLAISHETKRTNDWRLGGI